MPLFFILSGYVYALRDNIISNHSQYTLFVKEKAKTLMIPYYITGIITVLIKMPFADSITYGYSWQNILLLPIKPVEQLWFIYVLFLCFCLICFCEWKKLNTIIVPILMFAVGTGLSNYGNSIINEWGELFIRLLVYYIFFYAGYMARKIALKINTNIFIILIVLFVVLSTLLYVADINIIIENLFDLIIAFAGSIVVVFICVNAKIINNCNWIRILGRNTLIIYLVHPLLCSMMRRGMYMIGINNFAVHIIVATVLALLIPVVLKTIYKKALIRCKVV